MPGLAIRRRGAVWYAVGSVAGERIRKSLGTGQEARAQELAAALEARIWKRHSYGEESVRTFDEAAASYILAGGEAAFLEPLIHRFKGRVLGSIKPGEIAEAARALYPAGKPATLNRQAIVPARAVINHAADKGWCAPIRVKSFAVQRVRRKAVDRAWIDAFLAQSDADKLPHLSAAVLFMYQTGTRVGEAARIMPADVDLGARKILLARTKTGEWEERWLTDELVVRLANLATHPRLPLFRYADRFGIANRMKAVCRRAGIAYVSPHQAGRHSFATTALAGGAKLGEVMKAGGWKSARMVLEIYDHPEDAGRVVAGIFDAETGSNLTHPRSGTRPKRQRRK
jgi:integrase